jgi:hypothetical protein
MRGFLKIGRINPASDPRRGPVYGKNNNLIKWAKPKAASNEAAL